MADLKTFNLLREVEGPMKSELVEVLANSDARNLRIERIVSRGHSSPPGFWYDQDEVEWVMVVCGSGEIEFHPEEKIPPAILGPGQSVLIPSRVKHRVKETSNHSDTIWLAVFWSES